MVLQSFGGNTMTPEIIKETKCHIKIMEAYLAGKSILMRRKDELTWRPCKEPMWHWVNVDYKIDETIRVLMYWYLNTIDGLVNAHQEKKEKHYLKFLRTTEEMIECAD